MEATRQGLKCRYPVTGAGLSCRYNKAWEGDVGGEPLLWSVEEIRAPS